MSRGKANLQGKIFNYVAWVKNIPYLFFSLSQKYLLKQSSSIQQFPLLLILEYFYLTLCPTCLKAIIKALKNDNMS